MNLEQQVCSLSLAKEMAELGFEQDSLWWWVHPWERFSFNENKAAWILTQYSDTREKYPAYTVAELGEMLPKCYTSWKLARTWGCCNEIDEDTELVALANTEANARAQMCILLRKEGVI